MSGGPEADAQEREVRELLRRVELGSERSGHELRAVLDAVRALRRDVAEVHREVRRVLDDQGI